MTLLAHAMLYLFVLLLLLLLVGRLLSCGMLIEMMGS